jgi:apolipoprotein D and lipocalin family protein
LIRADYWVIDLAEDYSYAVVGTPNRDYLWILSRERTMDVATYHRITTRAASQGFEVERIVRTTVQEAPLDRGD